MKNVVIWLTLCTFTFSTVACSTVKNVSLDSGEARPAIPPDREVRILGFTSATDGVVDWNGTALAVGDTILFRKPGTAATADIAAQRELRLASNEVESIQVRRVHVWKTIGMGYLIYTALVLVLWGFGVVDPLEDMELADF